MNFSDISDLLADIIIWLLHYLVEASFDLFRYRLQGDQLKPWELYPLVSYRDGEDEHLMQCWTATGTSGARLGV